MESEILDRHDIVGRDRMKYVGRGGTAELSWTKLRWKPMRRRLLRDADDRAAEVAARWAKHLGRAYVQLMSIEEVMQRRCADGTSETCLEGEKQTPATRLGAALLGLQGFFRRLRGSSGTLKRLPQEERVFFELGVDLFMLDDWQEQAARIEARAEGRRRAVLKREQASWRGWVKEAFSNGYKGAHAMSKVQGLQEVLAATGTECEGTAAGLADRELGQWQKIWDHHQLPPLDLPSSAQEWDTLPPLTVGHLRKTAESFPWSTAVGQTQIAPRSFAFLSDQALAAIATLFEQREWLC